jgi:hypothetical protein
MRFPLCDSYADEPPPASLPYGASGNSTLAIMQEISMLDVAYLLLGLAGFAACWAFVLLCERM